jgi:hypothetical protein
MSGANSQEDAVSPEGDRIRSGIADLDDLLGGLIVGDNVVWVTDEDELIGHLEDALLAEAVRRGQPCFYVTTRDPARLERKLAGEVTVLDARARGAHGNASVLETTLVEASRGPTPSCVVIDGLADFARRWGPAKAVAFFSRVCPRLFDLGALAYWRAPRRHLGRSFLEQITNVTQCVLEVGTDHLRVVKAEGRPPSVQGRLLRVERS